MSKTSAKRIIRIFVSSPSDVRPERAIARRVIARLGREFGHHFEIEAIMWEREPLLVSASYQAGIVSPRETDVVIVILWSRLGVPLAVSDQPGPLSGREVTGTEWEFEDALAGYKRTGNQPELLLYRKTAAIDVRLTSDVEVLESLRQKKLVEDFIGYWTLDSAGRAFVGASWSFNDGSEFEGLVEKHLRKLLERKLRPGHVAGKLWHEAPYRGLESFGPEHEQIFFGRARARNELRELLARQAETGVAFVLVMGASGSGKSSLVKAGLVPDLAEAGVIGRVGIVRRALTRPAAETDPVLSLVEAVLEALPELGSAPLEYTQERLATLLIEAPDQAGHPIRQGLSVAGSAAGLTAAGEARLLLVIDQLEELFTNSDIDSGTRERFVLALEALAKCGLVWVVATLRSDFFNRLDQVVSLVRLSNRARYLLLPPNAAEIGQIVRQPAREGGVRFEVDRRTGESLDDTIVAAATSDPTSLPLLEYLLDQLWHRRDGDMLTFAAYDKLGKLEGAIGARAEEVLKAQPAEVQAELPRLLRALVTVGQGTSATATARYADISQFAPQTPARRLVEALLAPEARLLVIDGGTIRIAHEALLRHWERARRQIAEDRTDLQLRARLDEAQARWQAALEADRDSLLLTSGLPLAEARDLVVRRRDELTWEIAEYVSRSAEADDARRDADLRAAQELAAEKTRAAEQSEKARRRTLAAAAVTVVLLVFTVAGVVYALWAQKQAIAARDTALVSQSRYVADAAHEMNSAGDCGTGLALALEVLPVHFNSPDRPWEAMAEARLQESLWCLRERKILPGHNDTLPTVELSPNGRQLVTASADRTARLWDVSSGREVAVLHGHEEAITFVAFSRDGLRVATSSADGTARLWDAETGRELMVFRGHQEIVWRALFSPDRTQVLTTSADGTARLWDATSGRTLQVLGGHEGQTVEAVFSPDGSQVLTSSGKRARLWEARTGKELAAMLHEDEIFGLAFSPNGSQVLTSSADATARLWDARSGRELMVFRGHQYWVTSAVFSSNGSQVLTSSSDKTARLWETLSGRQVMVLQGHDSTVFGATYSPDGLQLVTASEDGTARLWETRRGRELAVFRGHTDRVIKAAFSPDGTQVVTASKDATIRLWDVRGDRGLVVLRGHENALYNAAYSPDGSQAVTSSGDKTARLWDVRSGRQLVALRGHEDSVYSAVYSVDGLKIVTASRDKTARLWEARTGREVMVLRGHKEGLISAVFSADGLRVVTVSADQTARLWDARDGRSLAVLRHEGPVRSAVFSRDGSQVLTASDDSTARLWDALTGRQLAVLRGHQTPVYSAVYSPDESQVLTASEENVARLWDARSGRELAALHGHEARVDKAGFSPDGSLVVTASRDKTARLWDSRNGQQLMVLRGHQHNVVNVEFSPDGLHLLTASWDMSARLWDARNGRELAVLRHEDYVSRAVFSPDGSQLLTASYDKQARLWSRAQGQNLLDRARLLQPRLLTPMQREQYFLEPGHSRNQQHSP
jgi:WD40 repeat protein